MQSEIRNPKSEISLVPLTNRAAPDAPGRFLLPADGWYHLIPRGEFPHQESQTIQVLDDRAMQEIVNRFNQEAQAQNFAGTLIDYDHFSYDTNKPSTAAGWIAELQNRADGVWAKIRWSDEGEQAIANGRYRFISPVWLPRDVEPAGKSEIRNPKSAIGKIRPLRLDSAGLTNQPNLRGMAPLSNRLNGEPTADQFRRDAGAPSADNQNQPQQKGTMKNIATKLGLSAEASEDAILAEVTKLQNRAVDAEKAAEPLKNRVAELETQNKNLLDAQVATDVERYANRVKPEDKPKIEAALRKDRAGTIALLDLMPIANAGSNGHGAVLNRADGKTPAVSPANSDPTIAEQMKAAIAEEMKDGKTTKAAAFGIIANRKPDLYKAWREAGAPNWN